MRVLSSTGVIFGFLLVATGLCLGGPSAVSDEPSSPILADYMRSLETLKNRDVEVSARGVEKMEWIKSGVLERARHRTVRYLRSGSSRLVQASPAPDDPSGSSFLDQLACSKRSSSFLLKRNSDASAYRLNYLGQNENAPKFLFDLYDLNIYKFSGYLVSYPITTLLQSPDFKVAGVDVGEGGDGLIRFRVSFRDLELPEVVFQGWFDVDSHLGWIIKNYEFKTNDNKGVKQTVKAALDYEVTADGLAIPKRSQSVIENESGSSIQKTTLEITDYRKVAPGEREFSLATYGLGAMESAPSSSWSFFSAGSLITFSFVCLILAVVFRKWSDLKSKKQDR